MQTAYIPVPTPARPRPPAWSAADIMELYELPFMDLVFRAQQTHRAHFDRMPSSSPACCPSRQAPVPRIAPHRPQSLPLRHRPDADKLMPLADVVTAARKAQEGGAQRFCMGAAWRSPKPHHLEAVAGWSVPSKRWGWKPVSPWAC